MTNIISIYDVKISEEVNKPKSCLLKAVWVILDGVGDAIDGTVEEISAFLFERLNKQAEGGEVNIAIREGLENR